MAITGKKSKEIICKFFDHCTSKVSQSDSLEAAASSTFVQALRATGSKTLVYLDPDPWAGMTAPGTES